MQNTDINCSTKNCGKKIQAACLTCQNLKCFNCSLAHAKQNPSHQVDQLDVSLNQARNRCDQLLSRLHRNYKAAKQKQKESHKKTDSGQKSKRDPKLNPQKFQQQLNYISSMQKQTIKIVEKFYSELSLQLVNIWEYYLNKFSNIDTNVQQIESLMKKIQNFADRARKKLNKADSMYQYFAENYQQQVIQCQKKFNKNQQSNQVVPHCPDIMIDQKMLISISETLCTQISTKNYQMPTYKSSSKQLYIDVPDTIDKNVNFMPIFPISKQFCYLYNIQENSYEIQQFDKLQFLPAFPKSIILRNGDIHLIGGADSKEQVVKTHIVFRTSTAQVFKLANIPVARNPINGLVNRNKQIFMIGGLNDRKEWQTTCYSYSLDKKQWKQLSQMNSPKNHQTCTIFNDSIFCFGIPAPNNLNIEQYDIMKNKWTDIKISNFLSNPFNFAAGFSAIQINSEQIFLFGGKRYVENLKNKKRSTDRQITPTMYLFQPYNQSFVQLSFTNPCIGVRDGEVNPVIKLGKIYAAEYIISKTQPICRWLSAISIMEISGQGKAESIMILHED